MSENKLFVVSNLIVDNAVYLKRNSSVCLCKPRIQEITEFVFRILL